MKKYFNVYLFLGIELGVILGIVFFVLVIKKPYNNIDNTHIPMPEYFRPITGYDSIQLIYGGRAVYNKKKYRYDVILDSLYANFCYPNKWRDSILRRDEGFYLDAVKIVQP